MEQQAQQKVKPLKLFIAVPNRGDIKMDFALKLVFMTHLLSVNPFLLLDGERRVILWYVHEVRNSLLPQSRQACVDTFLESESDFLLFLDDDMIFDPEFIFDWLRENRPVLAMNCPTKSIPCYPTARTSSLQFPFKGDLVYSDVAQMRWQRVWRVGTGIMLLRADACKALPRPAFTPRWEPGNDAYVGEDWALCEHLEAAGIPIIVDNKHSLSVRHVGNMAYAHEMVAGTRMQIAKQKGIIIPNIIVPNSEEPA